MKKYMVSICFLLLLFCPYSIGKNLEPTICRSSTEEPKFQKLAVPGIQILAVCPKKGIYFVELLADKEAEIEFKKRIMDSDLKVTEIKTYKEKTLIGSKVLLIEFIY